MSFCTYSVSFGTNGILSIFFCDINAYLVQLLCVYYILNKEKLNLLKFFVCFDIGKLITIFNKHYIIIDSVFRIPAIILYYRKNF